MNRILMKTRPPVLQRRFASQTPPELPVLFSSLLDSYTEVITSRFSTTWRDPETIRKFDKSGDISNFQFEDLCHPRMMNEYFPDDSAIYGYEFIESSIGCGPLLSIPIFILVGRLLLFPVFVKTRQMRHRINLEYIKRSTLRTEIKNISLKLQKVDQIDEEKDLEYTILSDRLRLEERPAYFKTMVTTFVSYAAVNSVYYAFLAANVAAIFAMKEQMLSYGINIFAPDLNCFYTAWIIQGIINYHPRYSRRVDHQSMLPFIAVGLANCYGFIFANPFGLSILSKYELQVSMFLSLMWMFNSLLTSISWEIYLRNQIIFDKEKSSSLENNIDYWRIRSQEVSLDRKMLEASNSDLADSISLMKNLEIENDEIKRRNLYLNPRVHKKTFQIEVSKYKQISGNEQNEIIDQEQELLPNRDVLKRQLQEMLSAERSLNSGDTLWSDKPEYNIYENKR